MGGREVGRKKIKEGKMKEKWKEEIEREGGDGGR